MDGWPGRLDEYNVVTLQFFLHFAEILELLERGQEPFMSPTSKPQPRHPMIQPAQTNHQGSLGKYKLGESLLGSGIELIHI